MNKAIMEAMGFEQAVRAVEECCCPFCNIKIEDVPFRDELSRKEYKISGLCQNCQDDMFGR